MPMTPALLEQARARRWFHRIRLSPDFETPGPDNTPQKLRNLDAIGLPADLRGRRVLDIGAWDGFFSFEMERRGATVVALDHVEKAATGFGLAAEILGSRAEWRTQNVYDLDPAEAGTFDVVLCLGVIYHLRHVLLGLDRIRAVLREGGLMFVETAGIDNHALRSDGRWGPLDAPHLAGGPLMQVYARGELGGDATNVFVPNLAGLGALLAASEFAMEEAAAGPEGFPSRIVARARAADDPKTAFFRARDGGTLARRTGYQAPAPAGGGA